MKHPLIIGAGGVTSYLLPVLLKTFKPESLTIVDKDELERRNLDRQMFAESQIGQNKASALIALNISYDARKKMGDKLTIIGEWFSLGLAVPEGIDAIFCCADNHMARHAAMQKAAELGCYAYIGGNEYVDSQALVYHPRWTDTERDLLRKYPNIATDETGSPFRCTGEIQEASPQLAMANLHCAAKLLHLAWVYERYLAGLDLSPARKDALSSNLPVEFYSSLYSNDSTCKF